MGWSSGSEVFDGVWGAVREHIPEDRRVEVCKQVVEVLEHQDWDGSYELEYKDEWPECVQAIRELNPEDEDGS